MKNDKGTAGQRVILQWTLNPGVAGTSRLWKVHGSRVISQRFLGLTGRSDVPNYDWQHGCFGGDFDTMLSNDGHSSP